MEADPLTGYLDRIAVDDTRPTSNLRFRNALAPTDETDRSKGCYCPQILHVILPFFPSSLPPFLPSFGKHAARTVVMRP